VPENEYKHTPLLKHVLPSGAIMSFRRLYLYQYVCQYLLPGRHGVIAGRKQFHFIGTGYLRATPINSGDVLLIIQMQGAQISAANDSTYGKGSSGDGRVNGYLDNAELLAGNMEYVVATNSVALAGGTVNLAAATINSYHRFGTDGQYRYQVIRVASYNNLVIGADISAPAWNGTSGGVIVIYASGNIDMNGKTISAAAAGFRGGGGMGLSGEPEELAARN
jgi:hypothetical protein